MALNDVWACSIVGQMSGVNWANTMLLQQTSADGVGDPWDEACDTLLQRLWVDGLLPLLAAALDVTGRRARRVAPSAGPGFFFPEAEAGGLAVAAHPPVGVVLVGLQTDLVDRRGRGRMKISGLPLTAAVDGRLVAARHAEIQAACDVLSATMTLGGGAATFRAGLLPAGLAFEPFTLNQVRARMMTQRSRQGV